MKHNVNETYSTKVTGVVEVLIVAIYLNIVWYHKNDPHTEYQGHVQLSNKPFVLLTPQLLHCMAFPRTKIPIVPKRP